MAGKFYILWFLLAGCAHTNLFAQECNCGNNPDALALKSLYEAKMKPGSFNGDESERNAELCAQCAELAIHVCLCNCGTFDGDAAMKMREIEGHISIINTWHNEHGKKIPPECQRVINKYRRSCKTASQPAGSGAGLTTNSNYQATNASNNNSAHSQTSNDFWNDGTTSKGNNSSTMSKEQQAFQKAQDDYKAKRAKQEAEEKARSEATRRKSEQRDAINEMTMEGFDGSMQGSVNTLAKGIGAAAATKEINAGVVAGGIGVAVGLLSTSPEEKARRAKEEAERAEREAARREEERRQNARNDYAASLKKAECVNIVSGAGASEIYTYYIIKTPTEIIFTDVFYIAKQDDGDWPYCADIENKLKAAMAKKNPKDFAKFQYFIQQPYRQWNNAQAAREKEEMYAEAHYWMHSQFPFEPYGTGWGNKKPEMAPANSGSFWDN